MYIERCIWSVHGSVYRNVHTSYKIFLMRRRFTIIQLKYFLFGVTITIINQGNYYYCFAKIITHIFSFNLIFSHNFEKHHRISGNNNARNDSFSARTFTSGEYLIQSFLRMHRQRCLHPLSIFMQLNLQPHILNKYFDAERRMLASLINSSLSLSLSQLTHIVPVSRSVKIKP